MAYSPDDDKNFGDALDAGDQKSVKDLPYVGTENPKSKKFYTQEGSFKDYQDKKLLNYRDRPKALPKAATPKRSGGKR